MTLGPVEVVFQEKIQTEEEYNVKLKDHNEKVSSHERNVYTAFVNSRVSIIVADTDDLSSAGKLAKVPMMQEKKRKLYLYQEDLNAKTDIE